MGQSGVRPIGNLFWDIGLIASYLLYWSLVVYPMTSDELKYARIVYYLMVGMVLVLVLYVQDCVTASFGRAFAKLRLWAWLAGAFRSCARRA